MKSVSLCLILFSLTAYSQEDQSLFDQNSVGASCPDLSVAGFDRKEDLMKFIGELKMAAGAKDQKALAKLVHYPLRVNSSKKHEHLKSSKDVQKKFATIFPEKVLKAIQAQEPSQIFCRDQGVMLGDGEVWIRQDGKKIGISTINL